MDSIQIKATQKNIEALMAAGFKVVHRPTPENVVHLNAYKRMRAVLRKAANNSPEAA